MIEKDLKSVIGYSRTYKFLRFNKVRASLLLLGFILPLTALWCILAPQITEHIVLISEKILAEAMPTEFFSIGNTDFLMEEPISFLLTAGPLPDDLFIKMNIAVTLAVLLALSFLVNRRPIAVFCFITFAIHLCSCLIFLFFPETFPYDVSRYSELYIKQQMSIFLCISLVMGCVTLLLPIRAYKVILAVLGCCAYSFFFAVVRYVTFIYIVKSFTVLYMAVLFFTFGPLIDFLYMVGIYSMIANKTSVEVSRNREVWQW